PKDRNCRSVAITRCLHARARATGPARGPATVRGRPPSGHPDAPPAVTPAWPAVARSTVPASRPARPADIASSWPRAAPPEQDGRVLSPTFVLLSMAWRTGGESFDAPDDQR